MNGKNKCKILKQIRQQIARDNDIQYITSECKYQGDCTGTCPKCEAELRYLEQELVKRQRAGKAVAVAGVALALTLGIAGCGPDPEGIPTSGDVVYEETEDTSQALIAMGDLPAPEGELQLMGEPAGLE